MTIERRELAVLTWTELQVVADRVRAQLAQAWARGEPGRLSDLYDLALLSTEASIRGGVLRPLEDPAQLRLIT